MPIDAPRNANIAKLAAGYLFPTIGKVRPDVPSSRRCSWVFKRAAPAGVVPLHHPLRVRSR